MTYKLVASFVLTVLVLWSSGGNCYYVVFFVIIVPDITHHFFYLCLDKAKICGRDLAMSSEEVALVSNLRFISRTNFMLS